jgi:hypothetical protein
MRPFFQVGWHTRAVFGCSLVVDGDDDFAAGVAAFKIPERFSGLAQWVPSIDHRDDRAGLQELLERGQIPLVWVRCPHVTDRPAPGP